MLVFAPESSQGQKHSGEYGTIFADEGNLFALDHAEATGTILHGRARGQEVTAVYHNEEGTKQGHVLATEGYNRGTYNRGRIGHGLSAADRPNLVVRVGGALYPGSEDHAEQLDTLMDDIALRNTHAHLNLSVYTAPVVQTLYVDDGTSSEDSGTFLATETIRAVTAGECGMERNLQKTRFYGKIHRCYVRAKNNPEDIFTPFADKLKVDDRWDVIETPTSHLLPLTDSKLLSKIIKQKLSLVN